MIPQGIRFNNPLNLRYDGTKWRGLADPPSEHGFCVFVDSLYGLRAAMINLRNYQKLHKLRTLEEIIHRHAPTIENPTKKYIDYVALKTNFTPTDTLDLNRRETVIPLVRAMAEFENGPKAVTYTPEMYGHAADMAGLA